MWRRIELHNHSVESDGAMTVTELAAYLNTRGIHAFSLTDHNTVSGWRMLPDKANALCGYELTSYYGHLLCQNVSGYVPWDDIDESCADTLFRRVHELGGLAGPAHPFSAPAPFSNGLRWTMKIHDYSLIDFIEIINNAHTMMPDNRDAILWWEKLVLSGYPIAPVSGMDFHRPESMEGFYTTYIQVPEEYRNRSLAAQLEHAIKTCRTCVTKGPVLECETRSSSLIISILPQPEAGFSDWIGLTTDPSCQSGIRPAHPYICQLKTADSVLECVSEKNKCIFSLPPATAKAQENGGSPATLMLFNGSTEWSNLIAVAGPFFL